MGSDVFCIILGTSKILMIVGSKPFDCYFVPNAKKYSQVSNSLVWVRRELTIRKVARKIEQ